MKKLGFLVLIIIGSVLTGCQQENSDEPTGPARLTFRLTDAPAAYDKVNIDIIGAEAIINDSIIDLEVNAGVYNLLDFTNGRDTVLVDQEVPEGTLSQIRLILGDNNTLLTGSGSYPLKTPSAQQSGLKFNIHADIRQGIAYEYVIDFDAARSIVKTGNGKYILKPVIKVFTKAVTGGIEGIVSPAKAKPIVYAISAVLDSVSAYADGVTGRFKFIGLSEGTYKLSFDPVSPYRDTTLLNIKVNTGAITKLDTLKLK